VEVKKTQENNLARNTEEGEEKFGKHVMLEEEEGRTRRKKREVWEECDAGGRGGKNTEEEKRSLGRMLERVRTRNSKKIKCR
jgi:hypothetical protein